MGKEEITGRCEGCRIIFTTKQVDDKCPICGVKLRGDDMEAQLTEEDTKAGVTLEEKKNGLWGWQGEKFHKCPQCGKGIPLKWKSHNCGWGKTPDAQTTPQQTGHPFQPATQVPQSKPDVKAEMNVVLNDAVELTENINMERAESNQDMINFSGEDIRAIANSMFIQKFKVMGYR